MIEKLFVYLLLLKTNFQKDIYNELLNEYINLLDKYFIENDNDELLIELEFCPSDIENSLYLIKSYCGICNRENNSLYKTNINNNIFIEFLLEKLSDIYYKNITSFENFIDKLYILWKLIPFDIKYDEPLYNFNILSDCLSYTDNISAINFLENTLIKNK